MSRTTYALAAHFALAGCLVGTACGGSQTPPEAPAKPTTASHTAEFSYYDAAAFYQNTSLRGASFSHDETRILLTTDATGIYNIYAQPVAGGDATALTASTEESLYSVGYFPRDDRVLYLADQGGNERHHLYVRETDGAVRDLTPGDQLKAIFVAWSGDKKHFWVATNERDPQAFDLYRYAADGYARELIFTNQGQFLLGAVSPNERWVALNKVKNNEDSDIYLWDTQQPDKPPVHITPHSGAVSHSAQRFTRDSSKLYYLTNGHSDFQQVWSYDLSAQTHKAVFATTWDVSYVALSEKGRYLTIATNEEARTVIRVVDTTTNTDVPLPALPEGVITSVTFSPSETKMAFYASTDRSPPNLFVLDLATDQNKRLTDSLNPAINPTHLVDGKVIRYPSFDGLYIPAIEYRPVQASASTKVPALVLVHGGPGGQSRRGYRANVQFLVNQGYAVLAVNNRGSSGYGKKFFHMDDRRHGEVDLQDCVWARKYLETLDWVDGNRIGIMGGSYGGYMVLAALAFEPDVFDVGIDIFGVANWPRTLKSIPAWWGAFRSSLYAEIGDPSTDGERLQRISPLFHADKIKKPLLVIQGANDPRVLKIESDEIVAAVSKNQVPVEYVVFDDEGHGFSKRVNRITAAEAMAAFLREHLGAPAK